MYNSLLMIIAIESAHCDCEEMCLGIGPNGIWQANFNMVKGGILY